MCIRDRLRRCRFDIRKVLFALLVTFACKGSDHARNIDLASQESVRSNSTNQEDPPPPEEEDSAAMALDEGKMGKHDSYRAEGQYKMKNRDSDRQLARQQAIEAARSVGVLGSSSGAISSGFDDSVIYAGPAH